MSSFLNQIQQSITEQTQNENPMQQVEIEGQAYYKISSSDQMRPFLMSIVSDSNHWMFISSNGGLSAGRKNADFALFPYYTDDKIVEFADITGSKTIFQVHTQQRTYLWEPFSERFNDSYQLSRNLYKSTLGHSIIFEEVFHDCNLTFRYQWNSSHQFGFVRTAILSNPSGQDYRISVLDGIQNLMPYGVSSDLQTSTSNLVDAYKRSELHHESGIGIYALSAMIVDKAEPSEALKANVAWSLGFDSPLHLLSSMQLNAFRKQQALLPENDIKGEKGAYFIQTDLVLKSNENTTWQIIANVNQSQSQMIELVEQLQNPDHLRQLIQADIEKGRQNLISLNAAADGLQYTADHYKDTRHFSNVLFNIMRGGIFDCNYQIEKHDFVGYLTKANQVVVQNHPELITSLPNVFSLGELQNRLQSIDNPDLFRLGTEYLPLKFSRRHGDPSRPWNKFSINTQSEKDGSKILDYQGNWRDIFQNWEALAYAYPKFITGMIHKFLNATTFDGYNPYRVTKDGFDWETIEPDNPWSYIGYWGDHQVIYLLKFLEFSEKYFPGKLASFFDEDCFVYAAVPYTIKAYEEILRDPKNTIDYNHTWEKKIQQRKQELGADGALLFGDDQQIYHVNFIEKILAMLLAKMANFIPEAGIWMNTQRPEWNDANNALVGNGVSMVTLSYLHRFLKFFQVLLEHSDLEQCKISSEMVEFYHAIRGQLEHFSPLLQGTISDRDRKKIADALGQAASDYRQHVYQSGFWGKKRTISISGLKNFVSVSLQFIEHTLQANKRSDQLYHAYNLISIQSDTIEISYLPEMLEGQVAILSSGFLKAQQTLDILDAMRQSALYRADQNSYILYPNKALPKFLEKNLIPKNKVEASALLVKLLRDANTELIQQDLHGDCHFNGDFRNADDLKQILRELGQRPEYHQMVAQEAQQVLQIFEDVFNHKAFTGRSGTFFAYEGLGSIYWHMVSKLHLAVQESIFNAIQNQEDAVIIDRLLSHYQQIGQGIGIHKSPREYGAFPTDPYSHTPLHRGAQQPGMTGQVKEDILTRMGELGIAVFEGRLQFNPKILFASEFLTQEKTAHFILPNGTTKSIVLQKGSIAFSVAQVPVVYQKGSNAQIQLQFIAGKTVTVSGFVLDEVISEKIFSRESDIELITVEIKEEDLRK